jgi:hypothetical protein
MVEDPEAIFSRGIDLKFANVLRDRIFGEDRAGFLFKKL